ncbi:MAG: hypothetical protein ACHQCH_00545 [Solirubrobacterales bacterium]
MISLMHRIAATSLVLAATAVLVAGCGNGTSVSESTSAGPVTEAQLVAYAHAVNLRPADVPRLQAAHLKPRAETAAGPFGAAIDRCESAALSAGVVFGISSQRFVHLSSPLQSVGSGVYYFKDDALAHEYLAAADSPLFAACVKTVASNEPRTTTREGSKVAEPIFSDARLSTLPVSLPGVQAYGLRLAAHSPVSGPGGSEAYTDFLSFVKGDAVITLTAIGKTHPFPAGSERRLLSLLYSRAEAHKL